MMLPHQAGKKDLGKFGFWVSQKPQPAQGTQRAEPEVCSREQRVPRGREGREKCLSSFILVCG